MAAAFTLAASKVEHSFLAIWTRISKENVLEVLFFLHVMLHFTPILAGTKSTTKGGGFKYAMIATLVFRLIYFFRRIVRSSHFCPLVSPAI